MIVNIPKNLLKEFRTLWKASKHDLSVEDLDELYFICNGYLLNERFYMTKNKAEFIRINPYVEDIVLNVTPSLLTPVLPGAFDLKLELMMLNTSIINDIQVKSYSMKLYLLYNPNNDPIELSFPELRFLWNYIRAYTSILYSNEYNPNFKINQIKDQFLQGLSVINLATPKEVPAGAHINKLNNYTCWYNSSMYGTRWQDFVD